MFKKLSFVPNALKNSTIISKPTSAVVNFVDKIEKKSTGTFFEKWFLYWKNLFLDYKGVTLDVVKESREKPLKTITILSSLSFAYYCSKNNPDEVNFRDTYLRYMGDLILVNPSLQKKKSAEHLSFIAENYNLDQVRRLNLVLFSLMWVDIHGDRCQTYQNMCDYLKLSWLEFREKIIDVGFLNQWWFLSKAMEDYDVNY